MRPVSIPQILLKIVNVPHIFHYYRSVLRHALGRMTADERAFIPESEMEMYS